MTLQVGCGQQGCGDIKGYENKPQFYLRKIMPNKKYQL